MTLFIVCQFVTEISVKVVKAKSAKLLYCACAREGIGLPNFYIVKKCILIFPFSFSSFVRS